MTMQIGEHYFYRDVSSGLYPILSLELNRRVKNKEATNIVVVGEAGSGKSYIAIQIALGIDPRFGIDQIVFTYKDYVEQIQQGKMGMPIVFDEPSYAMGKREWYKQINQALVKTIESQRFLVRPLIIPIINLNLLDKTLRSYLIQFQVHVTTRGKARIYRMHPSQSVDKVYRYLFCTMKYPILNPECTRTTCLGCRSLSSCDMLRAKYERKKEETQLSRYDEGLELVSKLETKELTFSQLEKEAFLLKEYYLNDDKTINVNKLLVCLLDKLGINCSLSKGYRLKTALETHYPQEFHV